VVDIRLITDKNTGKSRGLAYVEFSKVEEVLAAAACTGQLLRGVPVMIKASEAEKNLAWEAAQAAKAQAAQAAAPGAAASVPLSSGPCWLAVNNLHPDLGEPEITQLFSPFGNLLTVQVSRPFERMPLSCAPPRPTSRACPPPSKRGLRARFCSHCSGAPAGCVCDSHSAAPVQLHDACCDPRCSLLQVGRDATGRGLGVAHLQFGTLDSAAKAMAHWHDAVLLDQKLAVTAAAGPLGTAVAAPSAPAPLLPSAPLLAAATGLAGGFLPGLPSGLPPPPAGAAAAMAAAAAAAPAAAAGAVITAGELDEDDEGGGIRLSAQNRVALMSRLAGAAGLPPPPALITPAGAPATAAPAGPAVDPAMMMMQGVLGPGSPIPTPCL
jgi:RNA-binding protein 39